MTQISRFFAMSMIAIGSIAFAHGDEGHASTLGRPGDPNQVNRTVEITMSDAMRFSPSSVSAQRNETIRFVLKNEGKLKHEMVLGTIKELKAHAGLMLKFPEMEHADPNQASVAPGKTGELVWQFTKPGTFDFACLQAGHYEAGMRGKVVVSRKAPMKVSALSPARLTQIVYRPDASGDTLVAQAGSTDMTDGEVRKIDKDTRKITIKHGEIRNLDMPGMTMLFQVSDPAMLDAVKPGDKVKFRAEKTGGAIVVTEIRVVR